jgi:hypothetical protein
MVRAGPTELGIRACLAAIGGQTSTVRGVPALTASKIGA